MGLLTKAGNLEIKKDLAFSDFVNKYKLKFCAVLEKEDNFFLIKNSIGFDGASILSSYSTEDYWFGICENLNELNVFTLENGTLNPLLQLFSFAQKDDIEKISVYRPSENRIFILCNQNFPKESISDLYRIGNCKQTTKIDNLNRLITRESKVIKMQVDFQEAVDSFIQAQIRDKKKAVLFHESVYNEISNRFICYFSKEVAFNLEKYIIRSVFVVTRDLTQEHLVNHIILNLSGVIGNYSEIMTFTVDGIANSIPEIKDYLQVE